MKGKWSNMRELLAKERQDATTVFIKVCLDVSYGCEAVGASGRRAGENQPLPAVPSQHPLFYSLFLESVLHTYFITPN